MCYFVCYIDIWFKIYQQNAIVQILFASIHSCSFCIDYLIRVLKRAQKNLAWSFQALIFLLSALDTIDSWQFISCICIQPVSLRHILLLSIYASIALKNEVRYNLEVKHVFDELKRHLVEKKI